MLGPPKDALAKFVLLPTKRANVQSLDRQWNDLARFMKGPGSVLARWLAVGQMHAIYKEMKRGKVTVPERLESLTMRHFVEHAMKATGVSRPTIYRYVERSEALVERVGPAPLRQMLSGNQPIVNDEDLLLKVAQLPPTKAVKVVEVYMRGGKGMATAARLAEGYLHEHRLSGLTSTHEPKLRGGKLLASASPPDPTSNPEDHRNVVYFGDALLHLHESIRPESVQCVVTSPPFYGQRDFGTRHWFGGNHSCKHDTRVVHRPFNGGFATSDYRTASASAGGQTAVTHSCSRCGAWRGQLGQEPDLGLYLDHMVAVFREVRRVLRDDGVCWIEIGDRLADKSLLLIPQRLALALREDGWIVRAEVVWHKLTALPESVTDRPTRAHSTILMLTRFPSYFYDSTAIMEPVTGGAVASSGRRGGKEARPGTGNKTNTSFHAATSALVESRNCRDVWSFVSGRFPEAHTATFPPALPERCILASTSAYGACARCGAPWGRRTHSAKIGGNVRQDGSVAPVERKVPGEKFTRNRTRAGRLVETRSAIPERETLGWEPACECGTSEVRPCIVLDPFAGSGTTLMVAQKLGRDYVGVELNENEYRPIIEKRLADANRPPAQTRTGRPASQRSARRR